MSPNPKDLRSCRTVDAVVKSSAKFALGCNPSLSVDQVVTGAN